MSIEKLIIGAAFVGVIALIAGVVFWQLRLRRRQSRQWRAFAAASPDLLCTGDAESVQTIEGTHRGVAVRADAVVTSVESERRQHTRFAAWVGAALPGGFELHRQGVLATVAAALGSRDIATGDAAFDRQVVVRAVAAEEARALLGDAALRRAILEALVAEPELRVRDGEVQLLVRQVVTEPQRLQGALDLIAGVARSLQAASASSSVAAQAGGSGPPKRAWRLVSSNRRRAVASYMLIALGGFATLICLMGISSMPGPMIAAALFCAALVLLGVLLRPRPGSVELVGDALVLKDLKGRQRSGIDLGQAAWGLGPWEISGWKAGSVLHLQQGDLTLAIGGSQYFVDQGQYQFETTDTCDGVLTRSEFDALVRELHSASTRAGAEAGEAGPVS